jgi:hypothetical protein
LRGGDDPVGRRMGVLHVLFRGDDGFLSPRMEFLYNLASGKDPWEGGGPSSTTWQVRAFPLQRSNASRLQHSNAPRLQRSKALTP